MRPTLWCSRALRSGLLGALVISTSAITTSTTASAGAANAGNAQAALTCSPGSPPSGLLFNNYNVCAVSNRPTKPTLVTLSKPSHISQIYDYHFNNGHASKPGTIGLLAPNGHLFGPFHATEAPGDLNWGTSPNLTVPAGTYTIVDSDPATWSQDQTSGGRGFTRVFGVVVASAPPVPPPPKSPPPPPKAPPLPFKACFVNSGSVASMGPCGGPIGTLITIRTSRAVPSPFAKIWFYEISSHASLGGTVCHSCATVTVTLTGGGNLARGGVAADSYYQFTAPPAMCIAGSGQGWAAFPIPVSGTTAKSPYGYGDIGTFTIYSCP
jgi:hypothetical protein